MDNKSDDLEDQSPGQDAGQGGDGTGTKRRRRGDAGERNYTCGCGKSYLSYPALYTHIKTKHEGITPAGTSQPQTNGKSGRGRPKKEDSAHKIKEEDRGDQDNDSNSASEIVLNYLRVLGDKLSYNSNGSNYVVAEEPETFDLISKFPTNLLRPEDYGPVLKELEAIWKNKSFGSEDVDKESSLKKTLMNKVFAIFIYSIGRHLTEEFYREFVFFLIMYRKALNELGWVARAEVKGTSIAESEKRLEFCAVNNGEYAPDICNDFITDKWAEYLPLYNLNGFKVLGTAPEYMKNAVFLTQHFCNWMNTQGYTNSKLQINDDDA